MGRRLCVWFFFFSSRRRHTRCSRDWSSDVCSSDLCHVDLCAQHGSAIGQLAVAHFAKARQVLGHGDRKSTRLNSSHGYISYAVFCLKKKTNCTFPTTFLTITLSPDAPWYSRASSHT